MTYPLEHNFKHHAPDEEKIKKHQQVRDMGKALAKLILESTVQGREQSTALTKVEEAVMWANAAIARQ